MRESNILGLRGLSGVGLAIDTGALCPEGDQDEAIIRQKLSVAVENVFKARGVTFYPVYEEFAISKDQALFVIAIQVKKEQGY